MAETRLSPTAGLTAATIVKNVSRLIGDVPYTDTHTNDPPNPATSLTVASDATLRWEVGDYLDWLDDGTYDIALVTAVAATTLTVAAGQLGSTAGDHAANARVRKNPRWWAADVDKAVSDTIQADLYPDLYAVYEETLTAAPTTKYWYEIAAGSEDVLAVYQKSDSTPTQLSGLRWEGPQYVDSTLAASKKAIYLAGLADSDNTIFVQTTRIPAVADLSAGMARVVEYGAAARLLEWEAAGVTGTDRRKQSGDLVPGQVMRDARGFRQLQALQKAQERAVLNRRWPARPRRWHRSSPAGVVR